MKLNVDYSTTKPASVIGITANKSVNGDIVQTEIGYETLREKMDELDYSCDLYGLTEDDVRALEEADEIVVGLDTEPDIRGYGIAIDGVTLNVPVVFERAEYEDIDIPLKEGYFEIALIEKPGSEGLTLSDVTKLYGILSRPEAFPVEIGDVNGCSSAMGFITPQAAEELQYEYGQNSELGQFISSILDDMDKESEDGTYTFKDLRIWMNRV